MVSLIWDLILIRVVGAARNHCESAFAAKFFDTEKPILRDVWSQFFRVAS